MTSIDTTIDTTNDIVFYGWLFGTWACILGLVALLVIWGRRNL